jgi:biotin carboxylase
MQTKSIVLAIDDVEPGLVKAFEKHQHRLGRKLEGVVLVNSHYPDFRERNHDPSGTFTEVFCDYDNPEEIKAALAPYRDRLLVVTCRQESSIDALRKVVPWLPEDLDAPSADSLLWSTEKKLMRDKMSAYDSSLTPRYSYLTKYDPEEIQRISEEYTFPVIVKANGLRASILVERCETPQALNDYVQQAFAIIHDIYARDTGHGEPSMLVEEMIQGDMYSTDVYVDPKGHIDCLPLVQVITAHAMGLPGFYSYRHVVPVNLEEHLVESAFVAARKAVEALELRASTAHIELFLSPNGWKLIELGPRIGGYREDLYREAFGIDHYYNDLAVRIGLPLEIPTKQLKYAAGFNIYADKEGTIQSITGIAEARKVSGVLYVNPHAEPGDEALFAGNGGRLIVDGILSDTDAARLEEKMAHIRNVVKINLV